MKGVLVVDTAGPVIGVAYRNDHQQEYWSQRIVRGADGVLIPKIAEFASRYEIGWVGVSVGPGAFTGLRVGVASALGFAFARGCPVIPLSSLQIRAAIVRTEMTLALLDARKGRVYAQFFDTRPVVPIALSEAVDISLDALDVPISFHAVGEGVDRYRKELEELSAEIPLDACRSPGLEAAEIAWELKDTALSPEEVQLNYIRPPDAKIPKSVGMVVGRPAPK
jgi:tRNA threonylcarbamoyladenosine biosynthesis protein TsaB